jgi:hypothetical protein
LPSAASYYYHHTKLHTHTLQIYNLRVDTMRSGDLWSGIDMANSIISSQIINQTLDTDLKTQLASFITNLNHKTLQTTLHDGYQLNNKSAHDFHNHIISNL